MLQGGVCRRDVALSLDFLQGFGEGWMEGNLGDVEAVVEGLPVVVWEY